MAGGIFFGWRCFCRFDLPIFVASLQTAFSSLCSLMFVKVPDAVGSARKPASPLVVAIA
jgi:hypothetical protein